MHVGEEAMQDYQRFLARTDPQGIPPIAEQVGSHPPQMMGYQQQQPYQPPLYHQLQLQQLHHPHRQQRNHGTAPLPNFTHHQQHQHFRQHAHVPIQMVPIQVSMNRLPPSHHMLGTGGQQTGPPVVNVVSMSF